MAGRQYRCPFLTPFFFCMSGLPRLQRPGASFDSPLENNRLIQSGIHRKNVASHFKGLAAKAKLQPAPEDLTPQTNMATIRLKHKYHVGTFCSWGPANLSSSLPPLVVSINNFNHSSLRETDINEFIGIVASRRNYKKV